MEISVRDSRLKAALQDESVCKRRYGSDMAKKLKNRLAGRLAKVQADIQVYNSVPEGQVGQVDVLALVKVRDDLTEALVGIKTAVNEANREIQRDIYNLAEKKGTLQFLSGLSTLGDTNQGGVAWWAHIGGFLLGAVLALGARAG